MEKVNIKIVLILLFSSLVLIFSCKKDYYEDGGTHSPVYNGTILDFLKSRPELFTKVVKVVELSGYSALLDDNKANITFFAPADESINKTIKNLNRSLFVLGRDTVKNLEQIPAETWRKFLGRYIYEGKSLLKDYPHLDTNDIIAAPGQYYISHGGEIMNIGVFKNDVVTKNSAGDEQVAKYAGYRQLIIGMRNPVATSDLQPTNGVVHVLNFSRHSFGFFPFEFINEVITKGIND